MEGEDWGRVAELIRREKGKMSQDVRPELYFQSLIGSHPFQCFYLYVRVQE